MFFVKRIRNYRQVLTIRIGNVGPKHYFILYEAYIFSQKGVSWLIEFSPIMRTGHFISGCKWRSDFSIKMFRPLKKFSVYITPLLCFYGHIETDITTIWLVHPMMDQPNVDQFVYISFENKNGQQYVTRSSWLVKYGILIYFPKFIGCHPF